MLPFFFQHYDRLVTQYFVFDNGSNDASLALLRAHPKVTLKHYSTKDGTLIGAAPGFYETPRVTNGYSDLILELFGPEVGAHARSSIGMVIPLNAPVNCEAEVEIDGGER